MAIVAPADIVTGNRIKFKSISDHDNVVWEGVVTGKTLSYEAAKLMQDLRPYYVEVKKTHKNLKDIELLDFFVLKVGKDKVGRRQLIFAWEYVDPTSLELIETDTVIDIKVALSSKSETDTILTLLKSHGYVAWEEVS